MLEGLDEIPWSTLRHAYGQAGDVPRLIRDLLADDAAAKVAINELWTNIWHQGSIYSATTAAVPLLIEVFGSPTSVCEEVGILLREIAEGADVTLAQLEVVRESVGAGLDTYLAALADREAEQAVRVAAAYAAGGCRHHADRAVANLINDLRNEADGMVLCSMLLALDDLAAADPPDAALDAFRDVAANSPHEAARGMAVIALRRAGRPPPAALDLAGPLAAAVLEYERLPWYGHGDYSLLDRAGDIGPDERIAVTRKLAPSSVPRERLNALWVANATAEVWRAPTPSIARLLAPLAEDPDAAVRQAALVTLMGFGDAAALCADAFASAVERFPDDAIARIALAKIRDRRPPRPLLDDLEEGGVLGWDDRRFTGAQEAGAPRPTIDEIIATWGRRRRPDALRALVRRGPEAIAAIDVLRADVDSPTRVVEPGQDIIERDEEWVRACRQAIEAIIAST